MDVRAPKVSRPPFILRRPPPPPAAPPRPPLPPPIRRNAGRRPSRPPAATPREPRAPSTLLPPNPRGRGWLVAVLYWGTAPKTTAPPGRPRSRAGLCAPDAEEPSSGPPSPPAGATCRRPQTSPPHQHNQFFPSIKIQKKK